MHIDKLSFWVPQCAFGAQYYGICMRVRWLGPMKHSNSYIGSLVSGIMLYYEASFKVFFFVLNGFC